MPPPGAPPLDLTGLLRPGDRIVWGQASAEPTGLTRALVEAAGRLPGLRMLCGLTVGRDVQALADAGVGLVSYAAHGPLSALAADGRLALVPCHLSDVPRHLADGVLGADVVLTCVSPADRDGWHTLGTGVGYVADALDHARVVVAEVNDRMPTTCGPVRIHRSRLAAVVHTSRPLPEAPVEEPDPACQGIAAHVAALVPDRATIQLGVGRVPGAVARALTGHRELGVHSGMVDDSLVDLVEAGAVTNAHKGRDAGRSVVGFALGTSRLYRFLEGNPEVEFRAVSYTHAPSTLASLRGLVAVNGAVEVDLTGAVNAEVATGRAVGGVGGQLDFLRGAARSPGGLPVIALPSAARGGTRSRVVAALSGPVTTARADVHLVVTEHGVARLQGRTLAQRARAMIAIAHPAFREELERAAHHLGR